MNSWAGRALEGEPVANPGAVILGPRYRITVLTPRLLRLEYSEDGTFEDRRTQAVFNRRFPVPEYRAASKNGGIELTTEHLRLRYDGGPFSPGGLRIELSGGLTAYRSVWNYGDDYRPIGGTTRTLDEADGQVALRDSLMSRGGFSVMDDSQAMLIEEDGWVRPRGKDATDLYFFAYGRDFLACLRDYCALCGRVPMLPRWALGNWWSRFRPYSDTGYLELIEHFESEGIPLSVSVIDMDWHKTQVDPEYGSGWTGYSWNRELFRDPERFIARLHEKGLRVALNLHPADGVRAYEDAYPAMAEALGADAEHRQKIEFDAGDPAFMEAYFSYLHHPHEEIGVDFWWVDWQQKGGSSVTGIDPLWVLNHYHTLDIGRTGKRGLILSRYAGPGSHRYPAGFSGDSCTTWASLDFQPHFTLSASNAGYGWWSHDIGGHMHGVRSMEMLIRWMQLGVFSPVMRLHASASPFNNKEPWTFEEPYRSIAVDFMRLRHRLIPYIFTMNERSHRLGEPLVRPLYYHHPDSGEAHGAKNEYYFGTELICCPITAACHPALKMASFAAWLPEGCWFDLFNGRRYKGGRSITFYRDITALPVLAGAGAIVPLCGGESLKNGAENPAALELLVFAGGNGTFCLYEDNDMNGEALRRAVTRMDYADGEAPALTLWPPEGDLAVPSGRAYTVKLYGLDGEGRPSATGAEVLETRYDADRDVLTVALAASAKGPITIHFERPAEKRPCPLAGRVFAILDRAEIEYDLKDALFRLVSDTPDKVVLLGALQSMSLDPELTGALTELIAAEGGG